MTFNNLHNIMLFFTLIYSFIKINNDIYCYFITKLTRKGINIADILFVS